MAVILDERNNDAERKASSRAKSRDLLIPDVHDPDRRAAAESDDVRWLTTYCADVFYNPFTPHQTKIIADCGEALRYGTQKCKAAPRGDGKSSIVKYLALKYALTRQVNFPLIIAATSSKAKKILGSLKRRLASRGQSPLAEDYPLECHVARYVDPWPSRARNVTANGQRSIHVEWGADSLILPTWEDEEPLGPIILSLGITSDDLQGCNIYDQRPDFVMLDDLDSRDSLAAEDGVVAGKIEEAIDKTVAGLGGQSRRLGQFMLCTITSREAAAYKYSDPKQKPAWSGERIAAIQEWPTERALWDTYIELRKSGKNTLDEEGQPLDVFGREAHQLYLDNREAMDAGSVLANPHNFEADLLPDGSQKQISALQRCFDYIADNGMESFQTEHQNDPPEDTGPVESGITPQLVQRKVNGFEKAVIPPNCTVLTHTCDVGKTKGFHWVVRAWEPNGTGYTIDYHVMDVIGTIWGSDEGLDAAIFAAVLRRMEEFKDAQYTKADGSTIDDPITLFDCRYRTDAVNLAIEKTGIGVYGYMGIGRSAGCVPGTFKDIAATSTTRRKLNCAGAYLERRGKHWTVMGNADHWKAYEHDRWMTPPDKPGCLTLWGEHSDGAKMSPDQQRHGVYAQHICAEVEIEEEHKGVMRRVWRPKARENDWLDASYMSCVAAAMKGIRLLTAAPKTTQRISLAEMAKQAQGR